MGLANNLFVIPPFFGLTFVIITKENIQMEKMIECQISFVRQLQPMEKWLHTFCCRCVQQFCIWDHDKKVSWLSITYVILYVCVNSTKS